MTTYSPEIMTRLIPGLVQGRPFVIVALLNARALGDLIFYHVFAASTKRLFNNAALTIYQRDDRDYKGFLLDMNHEKDFKLVAEPGFAGITIDSFSIVNDYFANNEEPPRYLFLRDGWMNPRCNQPHLVLTPSNMLEIMLPSFDDPGFLRIPDDRCEALTEALVGHGVDPKRWFCVINYREAGYKYRPARSLRDLNPAPFMELTADIIEALGGQVVRVGHPNMTPFPKRPGFIDLATEAEDFALHAFAVSRARFMIGTLTGISHLGSAVNTPTAITNCSDPIYFPGCWRDHDLALYYHVHDTQGRRIPLPSQHERDLHNRARLVALRDQRGYRITQNSGRELGLVARRLMEATSDCQGWRTPYTPEPARERPNRFHFPMEPRLRVTCLDFPDLAPPPGLLDVVT